MSNILKGIGDSMDATAAKSDGFIGRLRGGLSSVSTAATAAATVYAGAFLAIAGVGALAVKSAAIFDAQILLLHTHAGMAASSMDAMNAALLKLAPQVGFTADELAKAMYWIQSENAGTISVTDAIKLQTAAAQTAQLAHADLAGTTNTLAIVMRNFYGNDMSKASLAAGVLNAAVGHGRMTMDDFTNALSGGIIPVANDLGVKFDQLGASIDTMTEAGFKGNTAGTALRNMLIYLEAGGNKANATLTSLGLTRDQLLAGLKGPDGLIGVISQIGAALSNVSDPYQQKQDISNIFGRTRGVGTAQDFILHIKDARVNLKGINDDAAAFASNWQQYTQTTLYAGQSAKASIDALRIAIGQALEPVVRSLLGVVGPFIVMITTWVIAHKDLVARIIETSVAIAGLGALVSGGIGLFARLALIITSGPGLAFLALTGLLYLVVTHFQQVSDIAGTFATWFSTTFAGAIAGGSAALSTLHDWVANKLLPALKPLMDAFSGAGGAISGGFTKALDEVGNLIKTYLLPVFGHVGDFITGSLLPDLAQFVGWARTTLIPAIVTIGGAFIGIATVITANLVPVVAWFVTVVGETVVNIAHLLADNLWLVEGALIAFTARFVILKGIGMLSWFAQMMTMLIAMPSMFIAAGAAAGEASGFGFAAFGAKTKELKMLLQGLGETAIAVVKQMYALAAAIATTVAESVGRALAPLVQFIFNLAQGASLSAAWALRSYAAATGTAALGAAAAVSSVEMDALAGSEAAAAAAATLLGAGIMLVAAAAVIFGGDMFGVRTALKNFFFGVQDDANGLKALQDQMAKPTDTSFNVTTTTSNVGVYNPTVASQAPTVGADLASIQALGGAWQNFGQIVSFQATNVTGRLSYIEGHVNSATNALQHMGATGRTAVGLLAKAGQTSDLTQFLALMASGSMTAEQAIVNMAAGGSQAMQAMVGKVSANIKTYDADMRSGAQSGAISWNAAIDSQWNANQKWAQQSQAINAQVLADHRQMVADYITASLSMNASTTTTGKTLHDMYYNQQLDGTAAENQTKKQKDAASAYADMMVQKMAPQVAIATGVNQKMADSLHLTLDNYLNLVQQNPQFVNTMLDQTQKTSDLAMQQERLAAALGLTYTNQQLLMGKLGGGGSGVAHTLTGKVGGPLLAEGGVFDRPTSVTVGDGGEREWVMPFHKTPAWMVPYLNAAVGGSGSNISNAPPPSGGGSVGASGPPSDNSQVVQYLQQLIAVSQKQLDLMGQPSPSGSTTGLESMLYNMVNGAMNSRQRGIRSNSR